MKNGNLRSDKQISLDANHFKEKMKQNLPYAGIPVVVTALLVIHTGRIDITALILYVLIAVFGYIAAIIDLTIKRIPNTLVLSMLVAWVIVMTPKLFYDTGAAVDLLKDAALGFVTGGGLFLFIHLISNKGLGGGDVKFMAGVGLYLGLSGAIPAMLYGTVLAALTGLMLILLKKIGRKDKIPLAPFLYIGILVTIFLQ